MGSEAICRPFRRQPPRRHYDASTAHLAQVGDARFVRLDPVFGLAARDADRRNVRARARRAAVAAVGAVLLVGDDRDLVVVVRVRRLFARALGDLDKR